MPYMKNSAGGHDDELEFQIEYLRGKGRVIIKNKTQQEKNNGI